MSQERFCFIEVTQCNVKTTAILTQQLSLKLYTIHIKLAFTSSLFHSPLVVYLETRFIMFFFATFKVFIHRFLTSSLNLQTLQYYQIDVSILLYMSKPSQRNDYHIDVSILLCVSKPSQMTFPIFSSDRTTSNFTLLRSPHIRLRIYIPATCAFKIFTFFFSMFHNRGTQFWHFLSSTIETISHPLKDLNSI